MKNWGKAYIYAAVDGMLGHLALFNVIDKKKQTYSYFDLFPEPSPEACNCSSAGILGMVPNSIGTLQALEAIKLLIGLHSPLHSHLLTINFSTYTQHLIALSPNLKPHKGYQLKPLPPSVPSISVREMQKLFNTSNPPYLIDVRDKQEAKEDHLGGICLPLASLYTKQPDLPLNRIIILYCKTGKKKRNRCTAS